MHQGRVKNPSAPLRAAPVEIDRIVAVVNSAVITEFDLAARVERALRQIAEQKTPPPPRRRSTTG